MKRRMLFALLFGIVLSISIGLPAYAGEVDGKTRVDEDTALEMGERFFSGIVPNIQIESEKAIPFYGRNGAPSGFIVHISSLGIPFGYVVFDSEVEFGIAEFSFGEESAASPYASITESFPNSRSVTEKRLYKIDQFTYCLLDVETGEGLTNDGNAVNATEVGITNSSMASPLSNKPTEWSEVFMETADVYRDYDIRSVNSVSGYSSYSELQIEAGTKHYACAVSAMLTVCSFYVATDGLSGLQSDYMELWERSSTSTNRVESNGITYGGTHTSNIGPAILDFCSARGNLITASGEYNASWTLFKSCIDSGNMAIFSAVLSGADGTGHAMATPGYIKLTDKNDAFSVVNALMVCDGWNVGVRFMTYDLSLYKDPHGWFFSS